MFEIVVNVFHHFPSRDEKLDAILTQLKEMQMSASQVSQDLKDLAKKIDDATNAVAARLTALTAGLKNSMTDEELAEIKASLSAEADKLVGLGKDPTNPVPA